VKKGGLIKAVLVRHDPLDSSIFTLSFGQSLIQPASSTAVLLPSQISATKMDKFSPSRVQKRTNGNSRTSSSTSDMKQQARRGSQTDSSSSREGSQVNGSLIVPDKVQQSYICKICHQPSTTSSPAVHKYTLTIAITSGRTKPIPKPPSGRILQTAKFHSSLTDAKHSDFERK
jgi:hypothetical protein